MNVFSKIYILLFSRLLHSLGYFILNFFFSIQQISICKILYCKRILEKSLTWLISSKNSFMGFRFFTNAILFECPVGIIMIQHQEVIYYYSFMSTCLIPNFHELYAFMDILPCSLLTTLGFSGKNSRWECKKWIFIGTQYLIFL